jgi:PAS domain S-box-containing protein
MTAHATAAATSGKHTDALAHPLAPTPLEPVFSGLARLAATLCGTPYASICLTGYASTWCTPSGVLAPCAAPPRDPFIEHATDAEGVFEIRDVAIDARFRGAECVVGGRAMRRYAAVPVRSDGGEGLGVLAVYGPQPGVLSAEQRASLLLLAEQGAAQAACLARLNELALLEPGETLARALIESAPVAIYHTDATGRLTYVNAEYRRVFGLTPEQSVNDWSQGVHAEDRGRMEEAWNNFCRHPRPISFEYRTEPRDGAVRFFSEQVVAADGFAGFVGTISDFTDLVTARGNLRKAESVFRNTFDQAPVGVAYADRSGKFLRCNQAFCTLLGYEAAELEQRTIGDLTHAEDAARSAAELERLWSGAVEFVDVEKRYMRKDGSAIWIRVTTALVREGSATPECSVEFLRDITVRKQLAVSLLEQQTLLEAVITDLPVALLACNTAGQITHYNRAAAELHCVHTQTLTAHGKPDPLAATVYLADGVTAVSGADHPLARALRGETISDLELVIVPGNSSARHTLSSARRLVGPDGQILGAVAVIQDTTERKLADCALERVHKQLMAASREAGMAEVATNVLHNVGNILNSVNISASLVAERIKQSKAPGLSRVANLLEEKGGQLAEFLTADERGKRIPEYLAGLGEQLVGDQKAALQELALLRENLEHIKETVAMQQNYAKLCGVTETVAVVDLVEDSLRLNAGALTRHGVTLVREFDSVPAINVDKHRVLQILVNLIRNAKYACDESGRTDKRIILRIEDSALGVSIAVIDNGVGIAAENMGRLFTHGFTTRRFGHGFGLHSGALAAQEIGGSLRAESDGPGHGAAFILELPLQPRDPPHA